MSFNIGKSKGPQRTNSQHVHSRGVPEAHNPLTNHQQKRQAIKDMLTVRDLGRCQPLAAGALCEFVNTRKEDKMIVTLDDPKNDNVLHVLAVGPGYTSDFGIQQKPSVKPGDIIFIRVGSGIPIILEENGVQKECLLVGPSDILCVFPDAEAKDESPSTEEKPVNVSEFPNAASE